MQIIDRAKLILEKDKTMIEDKPYVAKPGISVFQDRKPPSELGQQHPSAGSAVAVQGSLS